MIEEITKGTPIKWRNKGFGYQPEFTGIVDYILYQDNEIEKIHIDLENPDDDITIGATNVLDQFDNNIHDKWLYSSQLVSVGS